MAQSELENEFWTYVDIGNKLPPQTADNMLIAYAYFKQATEGDNENERPKQSSNVIQTFKHDSWERLQGMPKEEAMQRYIDTIKEFQRNS
jgi:acyl-CoA-binding protein